MVLAQPTFHPFKDFLYFCNQEGVITQLLSSALPIFCAQRGNNPSKRVTHFSRYGKMHFKVPFFTKVCPLQKNVHFVVDSLMLAHTEGSFDLLYINFFWIRDLLYAWNLCYCHFCDALHEKSNLSRKNALLKIYAIMWNEWHKKGNLHNNWNVGITEKTGTKNMHHIWAAF